jgi:hypothetical protein
MVSQATITNDIIELIRPYIHEILRIVLDAKGRTLRELNKLVGKSSKFELYSITMPTLRL